MLPAPPTGCGLGPVAIVSPCQRQGVGSVLIRQGISVLRERGTRGIAPVEYPEHYGRFGFKADPKLIHEGIPPEYSMEPLGSPKPKVRVIFHAAFG